MSKHQLPKWAQDLEDVRLTDEMVEGVILGTERHPEGRAYTEREIMWLTYRAARVDGRGPLYGRRDDQA